MEPVLMMDGTYVCPSLMDGTYVCLSVIGTMGVPMVHLTKIDSPILSRRIRL
jgi:hypothetical protein